ncbi:PepSY domain-containing protein [Echinicola marina]|uniref:PepSY-associated TM helix domain-containing protein n=1 Tax=Echinicola marina TaxID=2859768 RepID=UPI001CF68FAF|nr:PepSY-associated TM helix domain-containing protein [Echinicola marina]UCS94645.1 PepSY domain-containing protein [Echinicola marina]
MDTKLLWRIHNWLGLYTGVVIAFLCITGAAALFRPEIDRALNPHLTKVEKQSKTVSLTEAVNKALAANPDKNLFEVELPKAYVDTWNIRLKPKEAQDLYPMFWEVYINPYTGEILGQRNYFESFSYYLRNIHVRFYEAEYGRQIVGLAGIALLISTLTGFLIYGKFMKTHAFGEIRKKNTRITQGDIHKMIGVATLVFNFVIAVTGAWLGLQAYLMQAADMELPNSYIRHEKPLSKADDTVFPLDYDLIMNRIQEEFPEMQPWNIRPTTNGEALIHIYGNVKGQTYERRTNKLVLDKADYRQLHRYNISEQDFGDKLFFVQESFHFGDFAGLPLKLLYCFLALCSAYLSLSGFIIYLERTKKQKASNPQPISTTLTKWSLGMLSFLVVTAILSMHYGIGIPSLIVTSLVYGSLLIFIIKSLGIMLLRKLKPSKSLRS